MRVLRAWLEFLKKQFHPPEDSIPFRVTTGVCVMIGIVATCQQLEWPAYGFLTALLTPLGFLVSYRLRNSNTWVVKALLSVGMVLCLFQFFLHLSVSTYDPRIPLAELLLWLQTLHSFDLPARRDLNYSLLVGLILISLAAVLSNAMGFVLYLVAFAPLSLLALHYGYLSQVSAQAARVPLELTRMSALPRMVVGSLRSALGLLLCGSVIFLFLPRFEGLRVRTLPVSWDLQFRLPQTSRGEVVNPSYPSAATPGQKITFNQNNYFGFNPVVDLNVRGQLTEEVVLTVRSSDWTYYRGLAFDKYDGHFWSLSDTDLDILKADSPPLLLQLQDRGERQIVQIFNVNRDLPNVVFAAYQPYQFYFPSQELYVDKNLSVRSPFMLEQGMTYSIISLAPRVSAWQLKRITQKPGHESMARFHETPPLSRRVRELAHRLADPYPSDYEKTAALCLYLQRTCAYRLDIPAFPEEAETVDYFLFEQKAGYCEQFATALTVLCREVGVPARYVNGYLPGTYNPFTGNYEIKNNEAHAWTEIYIRTVGWVAFDPSPGFVTNPDLQPPLRGRWLFSSLLEYLQHKLGDRRVQALDRWWRSTAERARDALRRYWRFLLAAGLAWMSALLLRRLIASRRWPTLNRVALSTGRALRRLGGRPPETPREQVLSLYREMEGLLQARGQGRARHVTPRQHSRQLGRAQVELLTRAFEEARYSTNEIDQGRLKACQQALDELFLCLQNPQAGNHAATGN